MSESIHCTKNTFGFTEYFEILSVQTEPKASYLCLRIFANVKKYQPQR